MVKQTAKLSLIFLATFCLSLAVSFLLAFIPAAENMPLYLSLIVSQALVALPIFAAFRFDKEKIRSMIPRRALNPWVVVCLIALVFALEPLLAFANYVSSLLFGNAITGLNAEMTSLPTITNVIFIAIMPAFFEETVFRGLYYQGMRKNGFLKSALVSALFFGLMHMNWNQFSYGFILGIVFAFLMEATGSIRASMLVHFGINFQSVMTIASYSGAGAEQYEETLTQATGLLYESGTAFSTLISGYLFLAAAISCGLTALLIWGIAKLSSRTEYMNWVLRGGEKRYLKERGQEPMFSLPLALAIAIPTLIICLLEILT